MDNFFGKPKVENGRVLCVAILDNGEETTTYFSLKEIKIALKRAAQPLHAVDHRGASVEEQDKEPVCECGHFKFWHSTYMSLYNPHAPLKCIYDGCDCDSFRPPNGN